MTERKLLRKAITSPLQRAFKQNDAFFPRNVYGILPVRSRKIATIPREHSADGVDPEAVHRREAPRKLIVMPAMLKRQLFTYEPHLLPVRDSQPQVIVLAGGEPFIEAAVIIKQTSFKARAGWAYQAETERGQKDIALRLPVFVHRIYRSAVAYPFLVGLVQSDAGIAFNEAVMGLQLCRKPEVVGIQEDHVGRTGGADARVPGGAHTAVFPAEIAQSAGILLLQAGSIVRGAVIHHDEFVSHGMI